MLQRELKITLPTGDSDFTTTQTLPTQTSMSGRSMSHVRNSSSVSMDSVSAVGIRMSDTLAEMASSASQSGMSVSDRIADVRNGHSVSLELASAAGIHKSATSQADLTSPATLSITDHHTVNGECTPTNCGTTRSGRGQKSVARGQRSSAGSQAGIVMSPADSEYDFVRELNFKYLRHVVLKFMLSREAEVMTSFITKKR